MPIQYGHLPGLDAVRFYASTAVVLFHLAPLSGIALPGELWFIGQYFGFAVPLFYISSAFGLMLRYGGEVFDRQHLVDFYMRRFFRIAPLFYVLIVVHVAIGHFVTRNSVGIDQILASLFFVFNVIPRYVEGFVWASWSIGVEMVFYLVFPALSLLARSLGSALLMLVVSFLIKLLWVSIVDVIDVPQTFQNYFFISHLNYFVSGIVLYFIFVRFRLVRWAGRIYILLGGVLGLVVLVLATPYIHNFFYGVSGPLLSLAATQIVWGLALSLFVLGIALDERRTLSGPVATLLGKVSFSTYLWHPLVIYGLAMIGWYEMLRGEESDPLALYAFAAISTFAVTAVLACVSYLLIERPGMRLVKHIAALQHRIGYPSANRTR